MLFGGRGMDAEGHGAPVEGVGVLGAWAGTLEPLLEGGSVCEKLRAAAWRAAGEWSA